MASVAYRSPPSPPWEGGTGPAALKSLQKGDKYTPLMMLRYPFEFRVQVKNQGWPLFSMDFFRNSAHYTGPPSGNAGNKSELLKRVCVRVQKIEGGGGQTLVPKRVRRATSPSQLPVKRLFPHNFPPLIVTFFFSPLADYRLRSFSLHKVTFCLSFEASFPAGCCFCPPRGFRPAPGPKKSRQRTPLFILAFVRNRGHPDFLHSERKRVRVSRPPQRSNPRAFVLFLHSQLLVGKGCCRFSFRSPLLTPTPTPSSDFWTAKD